MIAKIKLFFQGQVTKLKHYFMEHVLYYLKRHAVSLVSILVAGTSLYLLFAQDEMRDKALLAVGGLLQVGLGVSLILLVTKHAFPALNVQEKLNEGNVAIAIFVGLIAVAIAILF